MGSLILRAVYDKLLCYGPHAFVGSALFILVPPHDIVFVVHQPVLLHEGHAHGHRPAGPVHVPVISPVSALMPIQPGFCVSENFRGSIFQNLAPGFGLAASLLVRSPKERMAWT